MFSKKRGLGKEGPVENVKEILDMVLVFRKFNTMGLEPAVLHY